MSIAHLISKIAIAIVVALVGVSAAVAQDAPGKPIEFGARVVENGTMVSLSWMANREGGDPTSFCIYYAEGETEKMEEFELLAETESPANPNGVYS